MNYAYIDPGTGITIATFSGWLIAALIALAGLFGAPDSRRIVFTLNATEALNIAILGLLREVEGSDRDPGVL